MIVFKDSITQPVLHIRACNCIYLGLQFALNDVLGCTVFFEVSHPFPEHEHINIKCFYISSNPKFKFLLTIPLLLTIICVKCDHNLFVI